MSGIVLIILFFFISGSTYGNPEEKKELTYSFIDEEYPYFLTDKQIEAAINEGIESLHFIDDYILPEKKCTLQNEEDILFSYIEPPALTAANIARKTFHQYGRKVRTAEVKEKLMDEFLPFVVRFSGNKGYIYEIYFTQGDNKIEPYKTEVKSDGGILISYFSVSDINFGKTGSLHVKEDIDDAGEIVFEVDFSSFK